MSPLNSFFCGVIAIILTATFKIKDIYRDILFLRDTADIVFLALLIATILHSMGLVASFVRNVYIRAVGNSCLKRWQCLVQAVCIYLFMCTSIIAVAKMRNHAVPAFCLRFHFLSLLVHMADSSHKTEEMWKWTVEN
ncbi:hypothetical protein T4B_10206 [Trichinella pseudospiralis]|uniref:Uncharacterized protein n=1 Tax=Trichinella pseudospiralis TaxID=6337 RepID=A0A0V1KE96_TRIPS|nr:hypothetical protein T4B_10206 [Trichinella pseudospiralis]KRZ45496.1 hypothetical protein T4C_1164 [Trichinella pseudospiralis]